MACHDCEDCPRHIDNGGRCKLFVYDCPYSIVEQYDSEKLKTMREAISKMSQEIKCLRELDTEFCMDDEINNIAYQISTLEEKINESTEKAWYNICDNTALFHNDINVRIVAKLLSNNIYSNNEQATEELMNLLDEISDLQLKTAEDYANLYNNSFYTYQTWKELIDSEVEQGEFGMTEDQCLDNLNKKIWQLACGWFVQKI